MGGLGGEPVLFEGVLGTVLELALEVSATDWAVVVVEVMVVAFDNLRSRCSAPCRSRDSEIFFIHSFAISTDCAAKKADLFVYIVQTCQTTTQPAEVWEVEEQRTKNEP